jgi:tetratricopeptide (TPR) repeat protein
MRLFCSLTMILFLSACAPTSSRKDVTPAQHRQWVNELLSIRDMPGAIEEMRQAMAGNPNIEDALLYADLFESQGDFKNARKVYRKAFSYPADDAQKQALIYRLAILEATDFDNSSTAGKLAKDLPPVDSRYFDIQSLLLFKQGDYKMALEESQRALSKAKNNEEKGWAYFHMAQIYYELRMKRETFRSLFEATNNGRGYGLVDRITDFWEAKRHEPFPEE